jgi:hypothetical protein
MWQHRRMSDAPLVFFHRTSAGGCYSLILVFAVFPVMAVGEFLPRSIAMPVTNAGILFVIGLAIAMWFGMRSETRLEIGPTSLRLVERESVLGIQRPEQLLWECPLAELTHAKEVHTRVPSSRGGWNHGYALHLPGDRVIRGGLFGIPDDPKSDYSRIKAWLRARLGAAFTTEEKLG